MKALKELETTDKTIRLVFPDIARDALEGQQWLSGEIGRQTLLLMGNTEDVVNEIANKSDDELLAIEQERMKDFIEKPEQLNWMIQYMGKTVGALWIDLKDEKIFLKNGAEVTLRGPSPHIMIGNVNARSKGVGPKAIELAMDYLIDFAKYNSVYTRARTNNEKIIGILTSNNGKYQFQADGMPYLDKDGLEFQNFRFTLDSD